jgi:hypothetical protein
MTSVLRKTATNRMSLTAFKNWLCALDQALHQDPIDLGNL